jgi:hypothetical protein
MVRQPEGRLKDQGREYLQRLPGADVFAIEVGYIPGRKNHMAGMFDRLVIRYGRVVFVEWKSATGRLSAEQKAFHERWLKAGGEAYVISSMKELREIFPDDQLSLLDI